MQSPSLRSSNVLLIRLKRSLDLGARELLHLLRRAADKRARVEETVQLVENRAEERRVPDALEEVVVLPVLLDVVAGLVGEDADFFVGVLSREAFLDACHDDLWN